MIHDCLEVVYPLSHEATKRRKEHAHERFDAQKQGKGQSDSMASRWHATSRRLVILVLTILSIAVFAPTTFASGPSSAPQSQQHADASHQDAQWLKAKYEFRVSSGIIPGQGKGANTHSSILSTPFFNPSVKGGSATPNTGAPSSYTLPFSGTGVQWAAEPGDGNASLNHYNFPSGGSTDD